MQKAVLTEPDRRERVAFGAVGLVVAALAAAQDRLTGPWWGLCRRTSVPRVGRERVSSISPSALHGQRGWVLQSTLRPGVCVIPRLPPENTGTALPQQQPIRCCWGMQFPLKRV